MSGWQRNDHNGIPMRWAGRGDGRAICRYCETPIWWVKYALRRIPYEDAMPPYRMMHDHRSLCRMRVEGRYLSVLGDGRHRFATVRRPSARLLAATGRAGRRPRPWKAMSGRSSRDESVAHVPSTQAAGQTTGRAGAKATAPLSFQEGVA